MYFLSRIEVDYNKKQRQLVSDQKNEPIRFFYFLFLFA